VLRGAEWAVFRDGLGLLWATSETAPELPATGVRVFDDLPAPSRVALLAAVGAALRRRTVRPPPRTAVADAAVAAVFETARGALDGEVLEENPAWVWRRQVADAHAAVGGPSPPGLPEDWDREDWGLALDGLRDRVLWDLDFALADLALDASPDAFRPVRAALGIAPGYFTAVAPDPTPDELAAARRTHRRLTRTGHPPPDMPPGPDDGLPF
jgi:hypothetical protein